MNPQQIQKNEKLILPPWQGYWNSETQPSNSSWELFFLPVSAFFYLSQRWLPGLLLQHSVALEISHIDWLFELSVMADIWLGMCVCMCAQVYFKPCVFMFWHVLFFFQRKEDSGTKRCSEPKRHASWQQLAASCIEWVDLKCHLKVHANVSNKLQVPLHTHGQAKILWSDPADITTLHFQDHLSTTLSNGLRIWC